MTATRIAPASSGGTGLSGWFDVTASPYNAAGNNVTDDTAAVQAAITAAQAAGGGVVYFPPGKTFKISSTLTIAQTAPVTLQGGSGQQWSQTNTGLPRLDYTGGAGSGPLLKMVGAALSVTLLGLRFTYSNAAYTGAGTDLVDFHPTGSDAQQNIVRNCSFNSTFAINPANGARSMLRLNEFIIGEVSNCHFGGCQDAIFCGDGSFIVSAEIHNCTFNFAQSSFIRLGSGDIEALTIRNNTFEDCPANGAIYGDVTNQTYSLVIANNWFGDSGGAYTVAWVNGVSTQSGNFTGVIQGNRFANNPHGLAIVGDWLVIGNTFETGTAYRTGTFALTDIANFYNMAGSAVFEVGHPPNKYTMFGSRTTSGLLTNSEAHTGALHLGHNGAANGISEVTDVNSQLVVGVNGTNGTGTITGSPKAFVMVDYQTANNGANNLRLQAPGALSSSEIQLITGVASPVPVFRASDSKLAFFNVAPIVQASRAGQLTDSTGGTVTSTLAAGITDAVAKNAIASLAAKVNALETIIHNLGLSA